MANENDEISTCIDQGSKQAEDIIDAVGAAVDSDAPQSEIDAMLRMLDW